MHGLLWTSEWTFLAASDRFLTLYDTRSEEVKNICEVCERCVKILGNEQKVFLATGSGVLECEIATGVKKFTVNII